MSNIQKPNAQQAFGVHQGAERVANNCHVIYRSPSVYDNILASNLWPMRSGMSNSGAWFLSPNFYEAVYFEDTKTQASGAMSHYSIVGSTKDSLGVAMPAVTLECYTTADDIKRGECVSNSGGEYVLPSQYNSAHYVRGYKVGGSFNYGGTSDENLIPS